MRSRSGRVERIASAAVAVLAIAFGPSLLAQPTQTARPAAKVSGNRVISGVVISAANGQPLDGADITLTDTKSNTLIAETATDADGRFAFNHIADGKLSLRATHRGYAASAFDEHDGFSTAIVTGPGLVTTGLRFPIQPLAVIYGTITDDSGDPVQQGRVSLYRQDEGNGTGKIVRASAAISDDLGNYEFPRVTPGNYYIAVIAQPWYASHPELMQDQPSTGSQDRPRSPLDVAYATTYYADVTDSDSATPIPVKAGDRIPVNFTMHAVPAVHLSIQVPNTGRGQFPTMPQLRQEVFGSMEFAGMQSVRYSSHEDGSGATGTTTVELSGVAPGQYEMELRSPRGEPSRSFDVDATSDRQTVDGSAGEALAEVSGKVGMAGGGSLPPRLSITLSPQQGDEAESSRVERDGSFDIHGVHPGTYEVQALAGAAAIAATQLVASGGTVDGHLLKVGSAPVMLAATLVEGAGSVSGFAKSNGKPAPGVMVLLVPANPADGRELFRRDQSDSDGSFNLAHVIPGEYTLVAIADGWTLDWARAEVIGHYLPRGLKVSVPARSRDIQVKDAVEVQAK
jgi:5-hydroxyisourate hydrolase-like protein (transthyretin family)